MDNALRKPFDRDLSERCDIPSKIRIAKMFYEFRGLGAKIKIDWGFLHLDAPKGQKDNMHGSDVRIVSDDGTKELVIECEMRTADNGRDHFEEIWMRRYSTVHVLLRKEDTVFDVYCGLNEAMDRIYLISSGDVRNSPTKDIKAMVQKNGERVWRDDTVFNVPNRFVACFWLDDHQHIIRSHWVGQDWKKLSTLWVPLRPHWQQKQDFTPPSNMAFPTGLEPA